MPKAEASAKPPISNRALVVRIVLIALQLIAAYLLAQPGALFFYQGF